MANAASQRVLKFVKYLPAQGYRPIVVTVDGSPMVPRIDETMMNEMPEYSRVFRTPSIESFAFRAVPSKLIFMPDYYIGWYPFAVKRCQEIMKKIEISCIFAICPPFTSSIVASNIKKRFGLPYILDLSDPWTENPSTRYPTWINRRLDGYIEEKVIDSADKVLVVSDTIKKTLVDKYRDEDKFSVMPLAFDNSLYNTKGVGSGKKMKISYIGSFYGSIFTPESFLRALDELLKEGRINKDNLDIVFIGRYYFKSKAMIDAFNKKHYIIRLPGIVSQKRLMERMMESDLLLLIINEVKSSEGYVTTKLIEYLPSENKIFAIAPKNGEAAKIINKLDAGTIASPCDIKEIKDAILSYYNEFKKGGIKKNTGIRKRIKDYDAENTTKRLASMFDSLIE